MRGSGEEVGDAGLTASGCRVAPRRPGHDGWVVSAGRGYASDMSKIKHNE